MGATDDSVVLKFRYLTLGDCKYISLPRLLVRTPLVSSTLSMCRMLHKSLGR